MPLESKTFFARMVFLDPGLHILLGLLPLPAQYELLRYYVTDHNFTEPDFEKYRQQLNNTEPSLANRAGKHFKIVEAAFIEASRAQGITTQQMHQAIAVHNHRLLDEPPLLTKEGKPRKTKPKPMTIPIARPIDATNLARIFIALARHQIREQKEGQRNQAVSSSSSDQSQTSDPVESSTSP